MTTEELKNAAGFKAVDAEGNDLGVVTLSDIVTAVKEELAQSQPAARAASVSTLSEVSALAATDTYEDQLPQKTDVNWVRGLDAEGNPVLISKQSLASVVEGLIGIATGNKNGLIDKDSFNKIEQYWQGNLVCKLVNIENFNIWNPILFKILCCSSDATSFYNSYFLAVSKTNNGLRCSIVKEFKGANSNIKFYIHNNILYAQSGSTVVNYIHGLKYLIETVDPSVISGAEEVEIIDAV